jgi:hypothetical protein
MHSHHEFFQVRERTLTTFTNITLPDHIAVRAQHVSDRTTLQDSQTVIKLLKDKLNASNLEATQLREGLVSTQRALLSSQQALLTSQQSQCSAIQALFVSNKASNLVQQVSTATIDRLYAENRDLHLKLSLFKQQPIQAIVLSSSHPAVDGASATTQPSASTPQLRNQ